MSTLYNGKKIKLFLITGFLGSGKTTCINQLLNHKINDKLGIIVNEFGSEGIDGKFINSKSGLEMKELNNGSIFCQCIKEDFIRALCDYLDYDLEVVFIEASGLSDHSNMMEILETVKQITGKHYDYAGSICIVDSEYFLEQVDLLPVLERQVQYSNVIIINKIDLQNIKKIEEIEKKVFELNSEALVVKTSFCQFDINVILNKVSEPNLDVKETINTISTRPYSCSIKIMEKSKIGCVNKFIKEILEYSYRIKGFAKTEDGLYIVNCVNNTFYMEKIEDDIESEKYNIVVISKIGIKILSLIIKYANEYNVNIDIRN